MKTNHNQISVLNPFYDEYIEVDEGISELLEVLWSLGIETVLSCEEAQPGIVWIQFYTGQDLSRFLTALATVDYSFFVNEIENRET